MIDNAIEPHFKLHLYTLCKIVIIGNMNILKKIYCRSFQKVLYIAYPLLPYREPKLIENKTEGIPEALENEKVHHPLIVTDKGIAETGLIEPLKKILSENGISYSLYQDVVANPTTDSIEEALSLYKQEICDSIIAIGGGSSIDTAKAVGARVSQNRMSLKRMKGILKVWKKLPLLIAIPTTAGTGSEATLASVVVDSETRHKYAINSFPLIPRYAVLDPEYTYTLPPHLTASTGMDALTHAIEAYIGRSSYRLTRMEAKAAVRLIFQNIEKAYADGKDEKARSCMLRASYLAGCAFTRSYVGYVHAIAHSLGGRYNTPHGLANAVILPYVLENYGSSVYKKLRKLAIAAGFADELTDEKEAAESFIAGIKELNRKLNIPSHLGVIKEEDIEELSKAAEKEANPLYPVPELWDRRRIASVYREVMGK